MSHQEPGSFRTSGSGYEIHSREVLASNSVDASDLYWRTIQEYYHLSKEDQQKSENIIPYIEAIRGLLVVSMAAINRGLFLPIDQLLEQLQRVLVALQAYPIGEDEWEASSRAKLWQVWSETNGNYSAMVLRDLSQTIDLLQRVRLSSYNVWKANLREQFENYPDEIYTVYFQIEQGSYAKAKEAFAQFLAWAEEKPERKGKDYVVMVSRYLGRALRAADVPAMKQASAILLQELKTNKEISFQYLLSQILINWPGARQASGAFVAGRIRDALQNRDTSVKESIDIDLTTLSWMSHLILQTLASEQPTLKQVNLNTQPESVTD